MEHHLFNLPDVSQQKHFGSKPTLQPSSKMPWKSCQFPKRLLLAFFWPHIKSQGFLRNLVPTAAPPLIKFRGRNYEGLKRVDKTKTTLATGSGWRDEDKLRETTLFLVLLKVIFLGGLTKVPFGDFFLFIFLGVLKQIQVLGRFF